MKPLRLSKRHTLSLALILASCTVVIAALISWWSSSKPPEVVITPALDCNSEWLLTESPDIDYTVDQIRLYLNNNDPTLCHGQSMVMAQVSIMANRYFAQAIVDTSNPKHPCNRNTVSQCLITYGRNITKEMKASQSPATKAVLMLRLLALSQAVRAHMTNSPLPNVKGPDVNFAINLVDNLERDMKAALAASDEGQAIQRRREREEAKKENQLLDTDTIKLK